jgi:hypothetical protein
MSQHLGRPALPRKGLISGSKAIRIDVNPDGNDQNSTLDAKPNLLIRPLAPREVRCQVGREGMTGLQGALNLIYPFHRWLDVGVCNEGINREGSQGDL